MTGWTSGRARLRIRTRRVVVLEFAVDPTASSSEAKVWRSTLPPCDGVSGYHSLAGRSDGEVGAGAGVRVCYVEFPVAIVQKRETCYFRGAFSF